MPKKQLSSSEAFDLRQALHVATLSALVSSRRWEPGDLIFQGGTSLHLAHGSPRFSEDLDFLVNSSLKLDSITDAVQSRLANTPWLPEGTTLTVGKTKDHKNPHAFVVTIAGDDLIGAVRVKVELFKADKERALQPLSAVVAPVRITTGPGAGMQAFVPTADLPEIFTDKVFALGARRYLKPRDVFDLHWLREQGGLRECSKADMQVRLATYLNETPEGWLDKAFARRQQLKDSVEDVRNDLVRWLPPTWPLTEESVKAMVATAVESLENGIDVMRELRDELEHGSDLGPTA